MNLSSDWSLYAAQLDDIIRQIDDSILDIPTSTGVDRMNIVQSVNIKFREADGIIESLQAILLEVTVDDRSDYQRRIIQYKDILKVKRDSLLATGKQIAVSDEQRDSLFGPRNLMDVNMGDLDGYGKLKDNTYALNEGTSIIDDAIRTTSDTVDIATGTLNEMGRQRETLDHARGVNRDIGADLGRGARLLRGMSRRARQNQFILVCIIIAIVAVIGLIIFLIIKNIYDKAHPKVTPSVKTFHSLDR